MNESRRKMARLPAGATPIVNPIGGAPAVLCERDGTSIVSLPGVPGELEAIVEQSLDGLFARIFGTRPLRGALAGRGASGRIGHRRDPAARRRPTSREVYVKSRAKVLGSTRVIRVTLSARGDDAAAVEALLAPAAEQLLAADRRRRLRRAPCRMRATPPARALAFLVDALDRYWGLLGSGAVVTLEALVFAPRGMTEAMIEGGIVGAALLTGWLWGQR